MEAKADKIEANLNFGMCTAKEKHCVIQPQILPNLLDHSQRGENVSNSQKKGADYQEVVIGTLLGTVDGKIIDISNSFPMKFESSMSEADKEEGTKSEMKYQFDTEYLMKMIDFHRKVNDLEKVLGVYISCTNLDVQANIIVNYYFKLFSTKVVKSPLPSPIVMLFDPSLNNNKLEIKVSLNFDAL